MSSLHDEKDGTNGQSPFPMPPLPPQLPFPIGTRPFPPITFPPHPIFSFLRGGCWLVNYEPINSTRIAYDGTIRVEHNDSGTTASGDLYQRPVLQIPQLPPHPPTAILLPPPDPAKGIPIQPRSKYRYFLAVTSIPESSFVIGSSFTLGFGMWRFDITTNRWFHDPPGTLTASMSWLTPPTGYPGSYLEGDVKDTSGTVNGRVKMGWVSDSYRKVTIEIDTVPGCPQPLDNGAGETWATVFANLGFDMSLHVSDTNVTKTDGATDENWSDADMHAAMHAAMLARRELVNLDAVWHYHLLAVKHILSTPRGIMYDAGSTDSDHIPREGLGIASEWVPDDPLWGEAFNHTWGSNKAAYFRTAVHELGHALGLTHNFIDLGFMCTSDVICEAAGGPFPKQIKWAFADNNLKQLRHWPDVFIRPGGVPFADPTMSTLPETPTDLAIEQEELALELVPVLSEFPIGAPVRIDLKLTNKGTSTLHVPAAVSFKSPYLSGTVTAAFMAPHSFVPLVHCTDSKRTRELKSKESIAGSLTLLRGVKGALFPTMGFYIVTATFVWPLDSHFVCRTSGSCSIFVTSTVDSKHATAAHKVLANPDVHVLLMTGGDSSRLARGQAAIDVAMQNDTLKKHFAVSEAKCAAKGYQGRKGDAVKASDILKGVGAVVSNGERDTLKSLDVRTESGAWEHDE